MRMAASGTMNFSMLHCSRKAARLTRRISNAAAARVSVVSVMAKPPNPFTLRSCAVRTGAKRDIAQCCFGRSHRSSGSLQGFLDQYSHSGEVFEELLFEVMAVLQGIGTVVAQPDLAIPVFPRQRFERQVDAHRGRRVHHPGGRFGCQKSTTS